MIRTHQGNPGGSTSLAGDPAVSVVVPAYNCERFIGQAIDSVLAQSYNDFELLIVDDGSTDGTVDLCRQYLDARIRILSQPHRGLPGARNTGIRNARGRYLAFLDAHDLWAPDKLALHVHHLQSRPLLGVSYSHSAFIDEAGRPLGIYQRAGASPTPISLCVTRDLIGNGSNAVLRAAVMDAGHPACAGRKVDHFFFDEELLRAGDFELSVRVATQTRWQLDCIPVALTLCRLRSGSVLSDVASQRGYQFYALTKIFAYAPEVIERWRNTNISYLYWDLARSLVLQRNGYAVEHCLAAWRFDRRTLGWEQMLVLAAAACQRLLPARLHRLAGRVALATYGMLQRWRERGAARRWIRANQPEADRPAATLPPVNGGRRPTLR